MYSQPVSFGKAIKIVAPKQVTEKIISCANKDLTGTRNRTVFDIFSKTIFPDAHSGSGAAARSYVTQAGDTFILSGNEAKLMQVAEQSAKTKIDCNVSYLEHISCDREKYNRMKPQIDEINQAILLDRDSAVHCVYGNDVRNNTNSTITYVPDAHSDKLIYSNPHNGYAESVTLDLDKEYCAVRFGQD